MIISVKTDSDKMIPVMWIQEGLFDIDVVWDLIKKQYHTHKTHYLTIYDESYPDTPKIRIE